MTGEVETELRVAGIRWWQLGPEAFGVWMGARLSLGLNETNTPAEAGVYQVDVASEAIEAAAALGL